MIDVRSRWRVAFVVCVGAAVVTVAFACWSDSASVNIDRTGSLPNSVVVAPSDSAVRESADGIVQRVPADESESLMLSVSDDEGRPLTGVHCVLGTAADRRVRVSSELGRTGPNGQIQLDFGHDARAHPGDRDLVVLRKDGFVQAFVAVGTLPRRGVVRVTLSRGKELVVACVGVDGRPLPRIGVLLSRAHLVDPWTPSPETIPGPGPGAVVVAETDHNGLARFDGLGAGEYHVTPCIDRGDSEVFLAVEGPPGGRVVVPGPGCRFVLDEPFVSVVSVVGDEVVTMNGETRGCSFSDGGTGHLTELSRHAEAVFGEPLVVVARRAPGAAAPVATWRLLLKRSGWIDVEEPLRPWTDRQVRTLDCSQRPADPTLGTVRVRIPDREARVLWHLQKGKRNRMPELSVLVRDGATVVVPAGEYRLVTDDAVLQRAIGDIKVTVFEGSEPAAIEVPPAARVVLCELVAFVSDGQVVPRPDWAVTRHDGQPV
ncbi:MAG: hypothetical protein IT456_18600, partial [Planctomycetes bacterium]|nr:hypothetical protein [Planctomycetota bacterium]